MTYLETMLKENKVDDWKAYMRWSLLNRASGQLSTDIENANFDFYGRNINRDDQTVQAMSVLCK
jgi:predicted metalloendopeptidase